ncbi:MAG: Crp/Fnr family transcriptional regulator [Candidatus Dadabacteria bacterium]
MFELLHKKVNEIITLTEEEFNFCRTLFVPKKLRKRHYLLQEGDVCKYQAFVEKGVLRSYTIDDKGAEHILQFAIEGWWIADLYSFFTEEPSTYAIDAIEEAEVLLINKTNWNLLMKDIPKFEHYFRILLQNHLVSTQRRVMQSLTQSAEEKYTRFLNSYPDCVQRVPQHMIASYLGITRETLSRLRKQMSTRKIT